MRKTVRKLDGKRLRLLLIAGMRATIADRDYINQINVFPVADSDTGTNLTMTFAGILAVIESLNPRRLQLAGLLSHVANLAVDHARGNSGAIMAQYFEGLRAATGKTRQLDAKGLGTVLYQAAQQSLAAMSEPVEGTLPTVLIAHAKAWQAFAQNETDLTTVFQNSHISATEALAKTTEQLPALRQAGVVDAGAKGFLDMLSGMAEFIQNDCRLPKSATPSPGLNSSTSTVINPGEFEQHSQYRFCTECVVKNTELDRTALQKALQNLACDSLVIAGTTGKARVHLHTNNPAAAFLVCAEFGEVVRQKADDMKRQHGLQAHSGKVTVVTDSAADIDSEEMDRLHIHVVPARLILGDSEYLDKVSISPAEYYQKLQQHNAVPKTSQPPAGDFKRQFELLTSHGYAVIYIGLSARLSGTFQAAISAAKGFATDKIYCLDSANATAGEGLIASYAAEAAEQGLNLAEVVKVSELIRRQTTTYALITDLSWGVRGGRVPAFALWLAKHLHLAPLIRNSAAGELKVYSLLLGKHNQFIRFAGKIARKLIADRVYRIVIAHCDALQQAKIIQRILLQNHSGIYSCQIVEIGPAIGVHVGRGGVAIGLQDYLNPGELLASLNTSGEIE